jgi:hypothetical protein
MSAREAWQALTERTFAGAERVLWLGDKRLAPAGAHLVRDLAALEDVHERFDGIGWLTRSDLRAGLGLLRPRLSDGAALIVVLDDSLLKGVLTRALRLAPKPDVALTEACEALVLSGFEEPRLVGSVRPRIVLTARKPKRASALDSFFAQPARP